MAPAPERDGSSPARAAVGAMLRARSVALVGASARPGSFGRRMVSEVTRSAAPLTVHLVNPRYDAIDGRPCHPSLAAIDGPVDLVLLGVPDRALEEQVALAAARGDRSAVIFGSVVGDASTGSAETTGAPGGPRARAASEAPAAPITRRTAVARIATEAGLALCGGGCMGFVNVAYGLRAIGYVEADELPAGPVALVSHSGSAFSALLRSHRRLGYSLAVSSGQELVTTAAHYLDYALDQPETGVVALLLETMRSPDLLRAGLARAAAQDVPVVALTVGTSGPGAAMVAAHSGALAGADGAWEALFDAYGVCRVRDLDELADTLELFAAGRRGRPGGRGFATVHDSGAERAMVVDLADELGATFAPLAPATLDRLSGLLDPGLEPTNPLDVWGTGADTRRLFADAMLAMADDPAVGAVALAIDLVPEFDGDDAYPVAAQQVWDSTDLPVAVLSTMHSALDLAQAQRLRAHGVPVLEGARSGLVALEHLTAYAARRAASTTPIVRVEVAHGVEVEDEVQVEVDAARRERWRARLVAASSDGLDGATSFALLADYGIPAVPVAAAETRADAVAAADRLGWPVVLKTDEPGIAHKSDVGGVLLGLGSVDEVGAAYDLLADKLGPRVLVCGNASGSVELALGLVRDPLLGPLVLVASGGVLVELVDDRAVALPPVARRTAARALGRLTADRLLDGFRGGPPLDRAAVVSAVLGLSQLAVELGDHLEAVDINPVVVGPAGPLAVDVLVIPRP